jgi:hypothetical protein
MVWLPCLGLPHCGNIFPLPIGNGNLGVITHILKHIIGTWFLFLRFADVHQNGARRKPNSTVFPSFSTIHQSGNLELLAFIKNVSQSSHH